MYKNFSARVLGISGRQSDLIEIAMTYGFQGLDIDAVDLQKRIARTDFDRASRFLTSSGMKVSAFDVPCDLDSQDENFGNSLKEVEAVVAVAGKVKARTGILAIPTSTNRASFPQYFEHIRARIQRIASLFESHQVLLGLSMSTFAEDRADRQFSFIQDVDGALALVHACQSEYVGILVDTFHWTVGRGTWEQLASLPGRKVAGLNIADAMAIPEIKDSRDSLKLIAGSGGIIDNGRFAKILAENGYDGPITSCPSPTNLGAITRDAIVSKAQDALDAALSAANLSTQTRRPEWIAAQATSAPYITNIEELG